MNLTEFNAWSPVESRQYFRDAVATYIGGPATAPSGAFDVGRLIDTPDGRAVLAKGLQDGLNARYEDQADLSLGLPRKLLRTKVLADGELFRIPTARGFVAYALDEEHSARTSVRDTAGVIEPPWCRLSAAHTMSPLRPWPASEDDLVSVLDILTRNIAHSEGTCFVRFLEIVAKDIHPVTSYAYVCRSLVCDLSMQIELACVNAQTILVLGSQSISEIVTGEHAERRKAYLRAGYRGLVTPRSGDVFSRGHPLRILTDDVVTGSLAFGLCAPQDLGEFRSTPFSVSLTQTGDGLVAKATWEVAMGVPRALGVTLGVL